ncbi:Gfo/Idh/MocA family protein [Singulisphaera sp. PoT]|uniref:Gfo/Idh/MocA family protein n=1 Tax=Singulisphaera sp. PoT TaxID=3411797 RepID=UPI003BF50E0D
MSQLKVGIIGAGYWGPNLIRNFSNCPLTEVAAVLDTNPARLEKIGRAYNHVRLVDNIDHLLDLKLDAVAIATPVSTHHALAERCLQAGLHVLVEKPLAANVQEAEALVELATRLGRILMVDHTYLFNSSVRKIKELIEYGELGDLYYIDSVRINLGLLQHDVNVIWDLAPHDLSIADHVVGLPARSISAWGAAHARRGIEDLAYVNVDYGDRMLANFHVNWLSPVKIRQMIFAGSRKSLIFNELNTTEPIKVFDRGIELGQSVEDRTKLLVDYRAGDVWSPHVEPTEALQGTVTQFAESIRDGKPPLSDGHLGLRIVQMLEAATRSIRAQGGRVVLTQGTYTNGQTKPSPSGLDERNTNRAGGATGARRKPALLR